MTIHRGDLFWIGPDESRGDYAHPHVVVQDDVFNQSRIERVDQILDGLRFQQASFFRR